MTEKTTNVLLDAVTQMESAVFRAGQVARRLLSEHPDRTVKRATCSLYTYIDGHYSEPAVPKLDLIADSLDDARAWAQAIGTELTLDTRETTYHVFETGVCEANVDGVLVQVTGSRTLSDDEAAAWRTRATDGGEG
ncbi:hypothetical protein [Streptomyces graminilatus]|uniref:hypothetical protein n=1 Tax=Streptomyces graminilatus TaxID=1464070 RepID=UPI0006E1E9C9|nr:hypothetical protein [Streptomyces graminilatus]